MTPRVWAAIACLVLGVPVAAWGLANGSMLIGILGLALVLVFIFLVIEAVDRAVRPKREIPKSDNPAWGMREHPANQQHDDRSSL